MKWNGSTATLSCTKTKFSPANVTQRDPSSLGTNIYIFRYLQFEWKGEKELEER